MNVPSILFISDKIYRFRDEALPFYIYYVSSQYADQRELATGYGASILLLLICLLLFCLAFVIRKGVTYRALYRA